MKLKLSTLVLADALGMIHEELIITINNLVESGQLPHIRVSVSTPARLELADVLAIVSSIQPKREHTNRLANHLNMLINNLAPMLQPHRPEVSPSAVLKDSQLQAAVSGLLLGTGDPSAAAALGVRRVGDMIWISTSTPHMNMLASNADLERGELFRVVSQVSGAVRLPSAKRFGGITSKVIAVDLETAEELFSVNNCY